MSRSSRSRCSGVRSATLSYEREKAATLPSVDPEDMRAAIRVLAALDGALDPSRGGPQKQRSATGTR
ncbi:hypothetical protein [Catenulispora rubra]|uniref:hypothetical protein n=1 Tax=Catenulispora rubra TaxID=280293 RepID=UPI00189275DE|nr:hypothetical protein [Catenulispora rubra]